MRRAFVTAAVILGCATTTGCGVILRYIGEFTSVMITQKTNDLSLLAANATLTANLLPAQSGLMDAEASRTLWKDGQAMLAVTFLKRSGIGMYEVEGTVGYRTGTALIPMTYLGKGTYAAALPVKDLKPATIVVQSGKRSAEFAISPVAPVSLKAINGKAPQNATLDLGKDLTLDLALAPDQGESALKVSLISQAMGIKTLGDIGIFRSATRLNIPHQAFANMQLSASQDVGLVGIEKGDNYLVVERYQANWPASAGVGAAQLIGRHWAWAPVKVVGQAPVNAGLEVVGKRRGTTSEVFYSSRKPNAFYGPPLSSARSLALGSLRAKGCLYKKVSTSESQRFSSFDMTYTVTTTTIKTMRFPELPEAYWQNMLAELESGIAGVLNNVGSGRLLPMARLQDSLTYRSLDTVQGETTQFGGGKDESTFVVKPYRDSKWVVPESFTGVMSGASSTFAADRPIARMLNEAGLDGIVSASLDLQIATLAKSEKLVLVPALQYGIYGRTNGYVAGPTCYASGSITMSDGVPFNADKLQSDPGELARVVRMPELLAALEQALRELRAKEQQAGYDLIWAGR